MLSSTLVILILAILETLIALGVLATTGAHMIRVVARYFPLSYLTALMRSSHVGRAEI